MEFLHTDKAPAAIGPYSQAVETNGFVFTSGQLGIIPDTGALAHSMAAQTVQALENVVSVLKSADLALTNVVKTTCFLANMGDFAAFNGVYGKYFTGKPARSCVAVKQLPKNVLAEVEVIAVVE